MRYDKPILGEIRVLKDMNGYLVANGLQRLWHEC